MEILSFSLDNPMVQGFLLGQLSLFILLLSMFYMFCLRKPRGGGARFAGKFVGRNPRDPIESVGDQETCHWLNAFSHRIFVELQHQGLEEYLVSKLLHTLEEPGHLDLLGTTTITQCSLGDSVPQLRYASAVTSDEGLVCYDGQMTLAVDTELLINWPLPAMAALPVELSVSLVGLEAKVQLVFPSSPRGSFRLCLLQEPSFNLQVLSAIGEASKIYDLPKLQQIIDTRLRQAFNTMLVLPHGLDIPLRLMPAPGPVSP